MKSKQLCAGMGAVLSIAGTLAAPLAAAAQDKKDESGHRQQTKNQWRNIGIGSAGLGLLGLLKHDNTIMFAGAAGALYSANRYEQDRKSQSKVDHARADYFSRKSFTRDGKVYERKTITKNGKQYYQFVRK